MWRKTKHCMYLEGYPFFDIRIKKDEQLNNLDVKLTSMCHLILRTFNYHDIQKIDGVYMSIHAWPNNIGNGIYYKNREYLKYVWLSGAYLPTSYVSSNYSFRFDVNTPEHEIARFAVKICRRHAKRLLKKLNIQHGKFITCKSDETVSNANMLSSEKEGE